MGAFDDDFNVVDGLFAAAFGDTVSLHRGTSSTTGVTAEATMQDYEVMDDDVITVVQSRDYVLDVGGYQFSGAVEQPLAGDQIKEVIDGMTHVFQVMPVGTRPHREWVGTHKPQWLLHTKYVGTE